MNMWSILECPCGGNRFLQLNELRWTDGGGTVSTPIGFQCAQCGNKVDASILIKKLKLKQAEKELETLKEQLQS